MLYVYTITLFVLSFISVYLATRMYIKYAERKGILAPDIHKPGQPLVANRGGVSLLSMVPILLLISYVASESFSSNIFLEAISLTLSFLITAIVGFLDDLYDLGLLKVPLMILGGLPFIILNTYTPRPYVPFVGFTRLTIVYPLGILVAFLIIPNAYNMIDVHNGVMCFSAISVIIALIFWLAVLGRQELMLAAGVLGGILGFYAWNKYPAKVFPGNIGAYSVGALVTAIIILSRLEYIALIALLPVILRGFYLINSIGGIMTKEAIREKIGKPVYVKDGVIYPARNPNAPFSLTRMFVLIYGPMTEAQVIRKYYELFIFSSILAILTGFLMF